MERKLMRIGPGAARGLIARAMLGTSAAPPTRLGEIDLRPHQRSAVARIHAAFRRYGGALLADEPGTGKTYTAIAVLRGADRPILVAPAALRSMWTDALRLAGCTAPIVSFEALSQGAHLPAVTDPDLVIVDEAHHARNPRTRRYARLAALTQRARVLLLSATPVHNREEELAAQLALFLGGNAQTVDSEVARHCVVRRSRDDIAEGTTLPSVSPLRRLAAGDDSDVLDRVMALPPATPPRDGGDGGALLSYSLARQWGSSREALVAALRRRAAQAIALEAALESGRHPSRKEMLAWAYAGGTVQLAFPELVTTVESGETTALLASVRAHSATVSSLLRHLAAAADPDDARAEQLRRVIRDHPGERIVAFTSYAATVHAYFRRLRSDTRVAALTGAGGLVAGGVITRDEALRAFAPNANAAPRPSRAGEVHVLLTTDLLSEGVNLQDASVIVHLDLPWTPARLEQRIGRLARFGSSHAAVTVYALEPPASTDTLLHLERRLRDKLAAAGRAVGVTGAILPGLGMGDLRDVESPSASHEALRRIMERWNAPPIPGTSTPAAPGEPSPRGDDTSSIPRPVWVSAVSGPVRGFLALLHRHGRSMLLCDIGAGPTIESRALVTAAGMASGPAAIAPEARIHGALEAIDAWLARADGRDAVSASDVVPIGGRSRVLRRIASITHRAPAHLRARLASLAVDARRAATIPCGAGAERVLDILAAAAMPDEAWLRSLGEFGKVHTRAGSGGTQRAAQVVGVVLMIPPDDPPGATRPPRMAPAASTGADPAGSL